jgi:hypothetical protein
MCKISSSQGGEYEVQNLLGCTAVFLTEALRMEAACTSETSVYIQLRTRHYIPEDSELQELYNVYPLPSKPVVRL